MKYLITSRRARAVLAAGALVLLSLALSGTASAQTSFQATVTSTNTLPAAKAGGCSTGAFYCGTADIAGYGSATWNFYLTGVTVVPTACGSSYTATTLFTLASDGSTLAVDESGPICAPGLNGNGYFKDGPTAYGHPNYPSGTWVVDTADSTGQFAGSSGSGSDALLAAGAHVAGSYSGTLG